MTNVAQKYNDDDCLEISYNFFDVSFYFFIFEKLQTKTFNQIGPHI